MIILHSLYPVAWRQHSNPNIDNVITIVSLIKLLNQVYLPMLRHWSLCYCEHILGNWSLKRLNDLFIGQIDKKKKKMVRIIIGRIIFQIFINILKYFKCILPFPFYLSPYFLFLFYLIPLHSQEWVLESNFCFQGRRNFPFLCRIKTQGRRHLTWQCSYK